MYFFSLFPHAGYPTRKTSIDRGTPTGSDYDMPLPTYHQARAGYATAESQRAPQVSRNNSLGDVNPPPPAYGTRTFSSSHSERQTPPPRGQTPPLSLGNHLLGQNRGHTPPPSENFSRLNLSNQGTVKSGHVQQLANRFLQSGGGTTTQAQRSPTASVPSSYSTSSVSQIQNSDLNGLGTSSRQPIIGPPSGLLNRQPYGERTPQDTHTTNGGLSANHYP